MKKLILFLLFSIGLQAQKKDSICIIKQLFNTEFDGHVVKKQMYFKATLQGIDIFDDENKQYQFRKCGKGKCDIIHLVEKYNNMTINGSVKIPYTLAPYTITHN